MTTPTNVAPVLVDRLLYLRPLRLAILVSMAGELAVFLVFGLLLNGTHNWEMKLLWTVGFCGIGMGSSLGAFIDLLIVGRWTGTPAMLGTCALSTLILGIGCNVLCWRLDLGLHYFGGAEHPSLFLTSGVVGGAVAGIALGALLFTEVGRRWQAHWGI